MIQGSIKINKYLIQTQFKISKQGFITKILRYLLFISILSGIFFVIHLESDHSEKAIVKETILQGSVDKDSDAEIIFLNDK